MAVMMQVLTVQMEGLAAVEHMHDPQALEQQAKEIMVAQDLTMFPPIPVAAAAVLVRQEVMFPLEVAPQEQVAQEQHLQLLAPL